MRYCHELHGRIYFFRLLDLLIIVGTQLKAQFCLDSLIYYFNIVALPLLPCIKQTEYVTVALRRVTLQFHRLKLILSSERGHENILRFKKKMASTTKRELVQPSIRNTWEITDCLENS